MIRMDAMVMGFLSSSDRVVDLYGHCGTSVSVAFLEPRDRIALSTLIENQSALTSNGKLQIALTMAESIADLHGYKGMKRSHYYWFFIILYYIVVHICLFPYYQDGPIIHGDVQYVQWLFDKNDNVILSDFNRAEVMLWDEDSEEYCKYFAGGATGNVRI